MGANGFDGWANGRATTDCMRMVISAKLRPATGRQRYDRPGSFRAARGHDRTLANGGFAAT